MKHLKSINELFDIETSVDATVIKKELNPNSLYHGADIDILIDDIPYRYKTCIKNFDGKNYIYLSYFILDHKNFLSDKSKKDYDAYNFIVNKSMTLKVLNTLSLFLEEYKKLLLTEDFNPLISGFYYDADEERRRRIYDYYFKSKLKDNLESVGKGNKFFIFANLKTPRLLKYLYL